MQVERSGALDVLIKSTSGYQVAKFLTRNIKLRTKKKKKKNGHVRPTKKRERTEKQCPQLISYRRQFQETHSRKKERQPGKIKSEIPHLGSKRRRSTKKLHLHPIFPDLAHTPPVFQVSPSLSKKKERKKRRERVPARRYSIPANGIPIGGTVISGRARSRTD